MFSTRSPQTAAAMTAGPSRSLRAAFAALLAALAMTVAAAPAHAALTNVGPVNPATGYPDWYQDGTGLKLQPCLDGPPFCLTAAADLAPPDGEGFYWEAEATLPIGSGSVRLILAQEAAFAPNATTFSRVRMTVKGARANTTYTFTHPYGSATVTTDGLGNGRFSQDVGCAAAPCDWAAALGGPFTNFLRWNPAVAPAAPSGHVGDSVTPHAVTGGTVRNTFGFSGGGLSGSTNLFTVAGKVAGAPVPIFQAPGSESWGGVTPGASVVQTIPITSFGVPDAGGASNLAFGNIAIAGPNASEFTIVGNNCSGRALPSGSNCGLNIQFTPTAGGLRSAELDIQHNAAGGVARILLNGTGAVPAAAVAGVAGTSRLTVRKLRTTHRMSRARVSRRGLRLSMVLPQGTEIIKVSVNRIRNKKVVRKPVWLGFRVAPSRAGLYHLTLDSRALRRRMKVGLYVLKVTPGASKTQLGVTTTTRIRITR